MLIYIIILIWSVSLFGAVHTYTYTFMNIGIIIAFCRYCIQWNKTSPQLILPNLKMNAILILFSILILLYIMPLPQSVIQIISPESARMNQLTLSPMQIVNHVPINWGTIAVSNDPVRLAWMQYMVYVLFFWGLLMVLRQHKNLKHLCFFLITMGAIESLYGLSQTFVDSGYILWVPKALLKNKHDTCGTLINRNHFAALMTMLMLLSVAYSSSQTRSKKATARNISYKRKLAQFFTYEYQWSQKIIGITAASIMGLGIFFSSSRGGVIAALPGIMILVAALSFRKSTRKQGIIIILVGIIIGISTVHIGEDRLIHRFNAIQRAMESRLRYVYSTIDLVRDYALLGVGPSNFVHAFARYQSKKDQQVTVTHVHNDWLQFFAEMGFLGLFFFLALIFFFIRMIFNKLRIRESPSALSLGIAPIAVLASISVHSLFDFPLHIPGNMLIFLSICASGIQALHIIHHKNQSKTMLEYIEIPLTLRHLNSWIIVGLVVVSMTLISTGHFIAETYCNTVPNSTLNRNQNPEIASIQKAIFWNSANPKYWYKLAWKYIAYRNTFSENEDRNDWISAQHKILHALEQAVKNNPCEAEYHIRLAWEYHRMQYHETGGLKSKRIKASDIAMEHAAIVCGNKNYAHHMEIAHYWNMRSANQSDLTKQKSFWKMAAYHYRKALTLSPRQRCKRQIIKQLQMYRRNKRHFNDIFKK